jgi:archaemetzincin
MMRRAFALTALCGAAGYAALRAQAKAHPLRIAPIPFPVPHAMRALTGEAAAAGPIDIVPVGKVGAERLIFLCQVIRDVFGAPCRVRTAQDVPAMAFTQSRRQIDADAMLGLLVDEFPDDATRVLAVTESDMYAAGRPYVFGYGHLRDRVAVVSLARLEEQFYGRRPREELTRLRLYKAVVHELGHTAGDAHCPRVDCVMAEVADLTVLDSLPLSYCPVCLRRVREGSRLAAYAPESQFALGTALLRRGRYERAAVALTRAVASDPENAIYQNDLGVALLRTGNARAARRAFLRARKLRPDFAEPLHNLNLVERDMVPSWEPTTAYGSGPGPSSQR